MKRILCIATSGQGGQDEIRIYRLGDSLNADVSYYCVDRAVSKLGSAAKVWKLLTSSNWDLVYQEGTGITAGIVLILLHLFRKQKFVVSSGDPIGDFFSTTQGTIAGWLGTVYERLLYRNCTGFVGWTPYLSGLALSLGAPQVSTIEGGVELNIFSPYPAERLLQTRKKYGVSADHILCGVIGSLNWSDSQKYCYGYEFTEVIKLLNRQDISFLIVGDGPARKRLEKNIPEHLGNRVIFTGRLEKEEVVEAINIMDIGFITQSGKLGKYRLTTKLPEYLACGVPVAMSPCPGFFDYASSAGWLLPNFPPASSEFHHQCAFWLENLSREEIQAKAMNARDVACQSFDYDVLSQKFSQFVHYLLEIGDSES